jgi:NAD+ synthase (glutamine-hydrolysing)
MKLALLQCNTIAGDVIGNAARIVDAVRQAAGTGVDLCITPELALCGLAPRELLATEGFMQGCQKALQDMATQLADCPPVLVGAPVQNPALAARGVSNASVLLEKGSCRVISRKVFQGQGGSSDDSRYFDKGITCGIVALQGWRLGVVLCEDSWESDSFWKIQHASAHNPLMELVRRGVDGIVHMAASPFVLGGQEMREHMLSHVAARHHIHVFSANAVGGNDATVYSGQSLAFDPTGLLLARGKAFEEDVLLVDTAPTVQAQPIEPPCASPEEECWRALVLGTRDYVHKSGCSRAVVGLSGGMDSALVCAIAVAALGADNVLGVRMPSVHTSQASLDDAAALAHNLGVECLTLPIAPIVDAFTTVLAPALQRFPAGEQDMTFENLQARARGSLLMGIANRNGALVLNTGNKSESAVGYCTLYGDSVGALAVIGDVPKTFVYAVAAWFNQQQEQQGRGGIPQEIFTKEPTAELHPGQKDSDSLPPYAELDPIVDYLLSANGADDCSAAPEVVQDVHSKLLRAEFKRRQEPAALRVSACPFGSVWQIPLVARYRVPVVLED